MALQEPFSDEGKESIISEINMTPLIDIMLVLLIIFMVTSSVALESGLDIDLPRTKSTGQKDLNKAVIVSLDDQGRLAVQGKLVEWESLGEAIGEALRIEGAGLVVLEGDKKASLGRALEIMELAKDNGAEKFAIASESKQ